VSQKLSHGGSRSLRSSNFEVDSNSSTSKLNIRDPRTKRSALFQKGKLHRHPHTSAQTYPGLRDSHLCEISILPDTPQSCCLCCIVAWTMTYSGQKICLSMKISMRRSIADQSIIQPKVGSFDLAKMLLVLQTSQPTSDDGTVNGRVASIFSNGPSRVASDGIADFGK
jgi:hypothetical protein